jgi:CDP-4-dehydro-6-deoxyglucose reductase
MPALKVTCKIIEKKWLTPTVMGIRFEPSKRFKYEAGQFISIRVPTLRGGRPLIRPYSFASPGIEFYELCVKYVQGGPGTTYLAALKEGDTFEATAPFGDFVYESTGGRPVCFISTGTGIAPFRAMTLSQRFKADPPDRAINLFGARTEDEIIYPGFFEKHGVQPINAISRPNPGYKGYVGRVTDYLKTQSPPGGWDSFDFYLCGNGDMVAEVRKILRDVLGCDPRTIRQEVYFTPIDHAAKAAG